MNRLSTADQLMQLRGMTIRTGAVHEAQKLQLVNWPRLVPGVSTKAGGVIAKIDPELRVVVFECKSAKKTFKATKQVKLWIKMVDTWTKNILWPDTKTVFKVNGKVIDV